MPPYGKAVNVICNRKLGGADATVRIPVSIPKDGVEALQLELLPELSDEVVRARVLHHSRLLADEAVQLLGRRRPRPQPPPAIRRRSSLRLAPLDARLLALMLGLRRALLLLQRRLRLRWGHVVAGERLHHMRVVGGEADAGEAERRAEVVDREERQRAQEEAPRLACALVVVLAPPGAAAAAISLEATTMVAMTRFLATNSTASMSHPRAAL